MSKSTISGIIVVLLLIIGLTTFVFSKIQIESVFMTQTTGQQALNQSGITISPKDSQGNTISLLDLIGQNVGDWLRGIFTPSWFK